MQLTLLRPVVAVVLRLGRMQTRTFYRTLSMASAVTATHQQTLKESEFFFLEPTRLSGPASPRAQDLQVRRKHIEWSIGVQVRTSKEILAHWRTRQVTDLMSTWRMALAARVFTAEHKSQNAKMSKCRGRLPHP